MSFCFLPADILLPKGDLTRFATVACDQYTSEPEYWDEVKKTAEGSLSALDFILPECFLKEDNTCEIEKINRNMQRALENGEFCEYKDALIYVERVQSDGSLRRGIVGMIDLEQYDYNASSTSAIRATEKTVTERIPPRVNIRKDAPLEMPHVMLLFDDKENTVFSLVDKEKAELLYDFKLMLGAGSLKGYLLSGEQKERVITAFGEISRAKDGFAFCVGDGNHSLASAKECYRKNPNAKNRYALVEAVNVYDTALEFEPIYRVVFDTDTDKLLADFKDYFKEGGKNTFDFTVIKDGGELPIKICANTKLPVAALQEFLDVWLKENSGKTDYIHGAENVRKLCKKENSIGFLFGGMQKTELFDAVLFDGSLPRKTFSMGTADDKRFYLECRRIK